ncbi:MAG: hypothetical protein L3J67_12530, partial [Hyphomicrobiaceae bacterium]|nr:hypothetical protein [Hyphomicrobiaceae bacterium]
MVMRLGLLLAWLISGGIIGGGLFALLLTTSWVGPILIVLAGFWILPPIAESIIKDSKEKHSKMKLILTAFFCLFLGFVITGVAIDEKEALDKGFSSEAEYSEAKKLGLSTPEQLRTAKNKAVKMKKRENQRKREENP